MSGAVNVDYKVQRNLPQQITLGALNFCDRLHPFLDSLLPYIGPSPVDLTACFFSEGINPFLNPMSSISSDGVRGNPEKADAAAVRILILRRDLSDIDNKCTVKPAFQDIVLPYEWADLASGLCFTTNLY